MPTLWRMFFTSSVLVHIDAINGHNAFRRMDKTVQMLDQRGFTRAGVADNPNEFAFINRNGHAL